MAGLEVVLEHALVPVPIAEVHDAWSSTHCVVGLSGMGTPTLTARPHGQHRHTNTAHAQQQAHHSHA